MIVSHKHKFIFIKTEKTAGTSVEIALSSICGADDIITPISKKDEATRLKLGYRGKQNYAVPFSKYGRNDFMNLLRTRKRVEFYNHMSAIEIRQYIDQPCWDDYFKFTFERNPYDKLISWYYWRVRNNECASITEFIKSGLAASIRGYELYTDQDEMLADKVYKFEHLESELIDLSRKLNLEEPLQLPKTKAKAHTRKDKRHYSDVLNEFERNWVSKKYKKEMELFGYSY